MPGLSPTLPHASLFAILTITLISNVSHALDANTVNDAINLAENGQIAVGDHVSWRNYATEGDEMVWPKTGSM